MTDTDRSQEIHVYQLESQEELRFEVGDSDSVTIHLLDGTAELFGTELAPEKNYELRGCDVAIFTWHGCRLKLTGNCPEAPYKSDETPMIDYLNANMNLENMRRAAQKELDQRRNEEVPYKTMSAEEVDSHFDTILPSCGPRVLIVGPKDSGKTTLSRILTSYATRTGRSVTLVDLDPSLNMISIPGTVSAVYVEKPVDLETGIDAVSPLTHWYGWVNPRKNEKLYMKTVENLARSVKNRWICNRQGRIGGCIINTGEWTHDDKGKNMIIQIAQAFSVNVILVIDQERLYSFLENNQTLKQMQVAVAKLPKSGGVVTRDERTRLRLRKRRIRRYFYGSKRDLHPCSQIVPFSQVYIVQIGTASASNDLLPLGGVSHLDPSMVRMLNPSQEQQHSILAVSYAQSQQECISSNVAGFIHVSDVDMMTSSLTCLLPCPGQLPGQYMIMGGVTWSDDA